MGANIQVDWNAKQDFYQHLHNEIWDKISVAWEVLAEADDKKIKLDQLEKIYIKLKTWYSFVRFYLSEDEIEQANKIITNIDTRTDNTEFSAALELEPKDWTFIRAELEKFFSQLAYAAGKYGILPNKKDMTGDKIFL